ncbi:MAG: pyridoxal-phosphate dependent enzyme [Gemmatimonadetes bacterium]|jgi:cystathionine beta-synthase|nr:pyridoxal-phosphate dependent enzyme [Gemmatimonadota bacterium]
MPAPKNDLKVYDSILDTIGWTPLIRLHQVTKGTATPVWVKAELFNPGGSVKDRIGMAIIEAAEKSGALKPGGVIVEGTSGNTGVALALAATKKGYKCIFTMPDKMSQEKVRLLKAFGADVIITPTAVPPDHPDSYVMTAKRIAKETPNAVLANQFYNQANPEAHYATTGPEIWEQTEGKVTHLIAGAGTGGTITGTGRYLKKMNPKVQVICADPIGSILSELWRSDGTRTPVGAPYKVEGIGQDKLPETLDMSLIDEFQNVSDRDAFATARRMTREEGMFIGGSAGLLVHAALSVARRVNDPNACVVTFLCDTGERYLSKLYNDEWMRENQMLDVEKATLLQIIEGKSSSGAGAVVSLAPTNTVRQAITLMSLHDVSQLPVMDGGNCVGSVSDGALATKGLEDVKLLERPVSSVMDSAFPVVDAGTPVDAIVKVLTKANPAVLVRVDGEIRGIVTRGDMLQFLMAR